MTGNTKLKSMTQWMIVAILVASAYGFSSTRDLEEEERGEEEGGVWQNVLEENEGENYFEGDIIPDLNRNAVPWSSRIWKDGIIPYIIADGFFFLYKNKILNAIRDLEEKVKVGSKQCIKFVPSNGRGNHLYIVNGKGCSSHVGCQQRGRQTVNLAAGLTVSCMSQGIIQHELMHALGFFHEQSRSDRDNYITINWDNIKQGHSHNFRKESSSNNQGQPYDYGSLMHYGSTEFGKWGIFGPKKTITPKRKGVKIGQRNGPSKIDIQEIRLLYKCI